MYCNPIRQSYNPENEVVKLFHSSPESCAIIALNLNADGILDYPNAPLLFQIGPLSQNLVFEVSCESIL